MATFTSTAGARLVKKDSTTSNDTYVVLDDSKGLVLTGNASGDTIKIDGLSTDFTFKASGKTLTLTSVDDSSFRIQVQIANGGSVTLGFLDGGVTASYASTGSTKGVTLAGSAGTQKVTSKAAALADAVSVNEATASVDTFDTTIGSTTTTTTGSAFALDTTVDNLVGTSGDDTFSAIVTGGTNDTYQNGDLISGGSGTDILTLTVTGDASAIVGLSGIETVSIRLLGDSTVNALDFKGVSTIEVAENAISGKTLTLNNASASQLVVMNGSANSVSLDYQSTVTADTARVKLDGVSASTLTLRMTDDALRNVNFGVSGTNSLTLSAATATGSAYNVSVSGVGSLTLTATTAVSALSLAGFAGSANVVLGTGIDQVITGGASADTFSFGGAGGLTSDDTVQGGAGTDTVSAGVGSTLLSLRNVSAVEVFNLNFTSSTARVDASASDAIATVNLRADTASDVVVSALPAATVNLLDGDLNNVLIDTNGGNLSIVGGSASAASLDFGNVTVEGASAVSLTALGTGSVTQTFGTLTAASGVKAVTITTSGDADVVTTSIAAASASRVSISTTGSAAVTTGGGSFLADAGDLTSLTVSAVAQGGAADVSLGAMGATQAMASGATISLSGNNGGDVTLGAVNLGTGQTISSISLQAGGSSDIEIGALTGSAAVLSSLSISAGTLASVTAGAITSLGTSGAVGTITVNQAVSGDVYLGQIRVSSAGNLSVTLGKDAIFSLAGIDATGGVAPSIGNISVSGGGNASLGTIVAASSIGTFTYAAGSGLDVDQLGTGAANIGNISLSGAAGTANIANIIGSAVGTLTVAGSADVTLAVTAATLGAVTVTGLASSETFVGNFAGVVGAIDISLGSATNVVTSGQGNDTISLRAGSGADTISYTHSAQATDSITRFLVGTGGDVIRLAGTALRVADGAGADDGAYAATATEFTELASGAMGAGAYTFTATNDYIVISGTSFANATAMIASIGTGGAFELVAAESGFTSATIAVVWTDGDSSYVTLVDASTAAAAGDSLIAAAASSVTLARLDGIDRSALENWVVTNIDFEAI